MRVERDKNIEHANTDIFPSFFYFVVVCAVED